MNDDCKAGRLRMHGNFERLADITCDSHLRGRVPTGIAERDIALARLYSHAFRGQAIGTFYATRKALASCQSADAVAAVHLLRANELLADLANRSMDPVGEDVRALISTFHHYCTHIARTVDALDIASRLDRSPALGRVCDLFVARMEAITSGNGLHLTRDTFVPEQGSFVVPNLGITIVPLVYGDHHSWNLAWLDAERPDVPYHLHREGVEIHLGYSPMHGYTVLGDTKAELAEGYAMPIPPNTRHGYTNIGSQTHHLPFIFGSLKRGGWGVFFDVEPQPRELGDLATAPVQSRLLNGTVRIEAEIARAAERYGSVRYPVLSAERTDRDGVGGLELSVSRVTSRGFEFRPERFCAMSVVRGGGVLELAGERIAIASHDHFGIPAGLKAIIAQAGAEPLVLLDAVIRPTGRSVR